MVSILSPLSFLFQYTRKQRLLLSYILRFCGHIRNTRRSSACSDGTPNSSFWPMSHATVLAASYLQTTPFDTEHHPHTNKTCAHESPSHGTENQVSVTKLQYSSQQQQHIFINQCSIIYTAQTVKKRQ